MDDVGPSDVAVSMFFFLSHHGGKWDALATVILSCSPLPLSPSLFAANKGGLVTFFCFKSQTSWVVPCPGKRRW